MQLRGKNPTMATPRRIALLIRSLEYGGTEAQVVGLANGLAQSNYAVSLLVFYRGGVLFGRVSPEVRVRCLEKRGRWDTFRFLQSLLSALIEERPDVLYSFLPVANLSTCVAAICSRKLRVVWGVRASDVVLQHYDWAARLSYWLERKMSSFPDLIIANSAAGRQYAVSRGFPDSDRFIVIPNGIDVERFRADPALRGGARREWGVSPEETLVGIVGRLDPLKDHPTFLKAAANLARHNESIRFVSIGTGPAEYAAGLQEQACSLGLNGRVIWAGARSDMPEVYNALDVLVLSSVSEAFPNVLGEAMACGVACVSTDVGDAHQVLDDSRAIVPREDPEALAAGVLAILELSREERTDLGRRLRQRVIQNFSADALVRRTAAVLETVS